MTPEQAILGWFDPRIDGVLSDYSKDENYPQKVAAAASANMPPVGNYLGGGDMGHVWETMTGDIIKLSIDAKEARAATKLLGKSHPNVVTYSDVMQLGSLPIFILHQEMAGSPAKDPEILRNLEDMPLDSQGIIQELIALHQKTNNPGFLQLAQGMKWLLDNGVGFFDLNPGNILVNDGNYKIIDLGISKVERPRPIKKLSFEDKMFFATEARIILID